MSEITARKPVNPSQLSHENAGVGLRVVGPDADGDFIVKSVEDDVTEQQLRAMIAGHNANPDWVNPNPPPLSADVVTLRATLGSPTTPPEIKALIRRSGIS